MSMCRPETKEEILERFKKKYEKFYECDECGEMFGQLDLGFADKNGQICRFCFDG